MTLTPPFAQVIVDIAHADVDKVFTYAIPQGMALQIGMRVEVPFGYQEKEGYILGFASSCDLAPDKIRDIKATLEDYPAILPPLVELAREMSRNAHCPLAETLRLMIPAQLRRGRISIKYEKVAQLLLSGDSLQAARAAQTRSAKRRLLIDLMADGAVHPLSELGLLVRSPLEPLKKLEEMGVIRLFEREVLRSPYPDAPIKVEDPILTPGQEEVLSEIIPALQDGQGSFLLHGVTGSGKTEVYIRAVRETLAKGKCAIVLVPEIVLTPQMVGWFRGRFSDDAAVLHSRLSAGERYDEWRRIRLGQAKVVIGARSAVFAPVSHLGLIIVDEEHESSYVSDRVPAYDAREIAKSRARREGATVLLASATPSILSFAKARRGDYTLLEMPDRVNGMSMPEVTIVDMRKELRLGNKGMFSMELLSRLDQCMALGQQAMLFINRRGYAPSVVCRMCGHTLGCSLCDVSLTYHAWDGQMHCHYCGQKTPLPGSCPECSSSYLRSVGVGTQKVEEEVVKRYPDIPVVRLDHDTTNLKDAHRDLINRFRSGQARIMIGTQMIAKGLDFPKVTLVGAILADLSLNLPDYRSPERSFQLLTQVAGRAGRADMPGQVVIQTYQPEHYAIIAAASQDYRKFFNTEFDRRRRDLYPPFTMLARMLCQSKDEKTAREMSSAIYQKVDALLQLNPVMKKRVLFYREDVSPIKKIMGRSRAQVFLKLLVHPDSEAVLAALQEMTKESWPGEVALEINPASMA
ncbi:MAG: primosomal protein N' [Clostridiales bacterium]|nr:primosomal protein N' [Clostridiales bacterium]